MEVLTHLPLYPRIHVRTHVPVTVHAHTRMRAHTHTHAHSGLGTNIYWSVLICIKLMLFGGHVIENFTILGFIIMLIKI